MIFSLLLACTPTFDETRKDLEGFRLVAMAAEGSALRALVWSGEGALHPTAPTVTWTIDGAVITEAPAPPFTARVTVGNGSASEEGELVVSADAVTPVISGFTRAFDGEVAQLSLAVETGAVTRWMASGGTFTETGPNAADWSILPLPDEDGVVADPGPDDTGLIAIVGLTLDGNGGNTWSWVDIATDAGPYLAVGGRLLPVDAPVPAALTAEGRYLATLTLADTRAGLVLTDLAAAADSDTGEIVCGLDPFDADALADGRCGLDEASGARVLLTGAPWP
ncbi:MAG: hypothetical protein Q8P18_29865 [Pseudomonadota bacterium]|nr:hypothetical protein [Pseudomonadota bacterium]